MDKKFPYVFDEEAIRSEYGSVKAFLKENKANETNWHALKKKKTTSFNVNSQSWKIFQKAREKGYIKLANDENITEGISPCSVKVIAE